MNSASNQDDNLKPEELARVHIDANLRSVGWNIVNRDQFVIDKTQIVRENLMKGGKEADYVIFIKGKAIGVIEAKRGEIDVSDKSVISQVVDYSHTLLDTDPFYYKPIPFRYTSNGKDIYFQNILANDKSWKKVHDFHTEIELLSLFHSIERMPSLDTKMGLRACQVDAIQNIEQSIRDGKQRALAVLATGAGKTYLACALSYRLLKYAHFKRILFLVDRNNLGKQTEGEYSSFNKTDTNQNFTNIYGVCRLKSPEIDKSSSIVISTIQRLFSVLTGKPCAFNDDAEDIEDDSTVEDISDDKELTTEAVELDNTLLPKDYFDLIIVDECHRSIYNKWRKVLEHFNEAYIVGITATPIPDTVAFFNKNVVSEYTYEDSVVDGVNVDSRTYRIKTAISEKDVSQVNIGEEYSQIGVFKNTTEDKVTNDEKQYTKGELNRAVIYEDQIRKILQEYKSVVYTKLYPEREPIYDYLPKTLIFALNERHAKSIVKIVKEVFGEECAKNDQFVQQITYSMPNNSNLIKTFRNDQKTRIAVTVNLIATGTDIKGLEVVLFLRDVQSESTYIQMKGRGCRTISDDVLFNLTPNAVDGKECFYIIDAVGVTEHQFKVPATVLDGGENSTYVSLKLLLEQIARGYLPDENLKLIAQKALRIHSKSDEEQRNKFTELAGIDLQTFAQDIYKAFEENNIPPFNSVNEDNYIRKNLVRYLSENYQAREYMLILNAGFIDVYKKVADEVIESDFSYESATKHVSAFKNYIEQHKDDIEALRIIYNNEKTPITRAMIEDLDAKIRLNLAECSINILWNDFKLLDESKDKVISLKKDSANSDYKAMTNLIQLVRFALGRLPILRSIVSTHSQFFELWCGKRNRNITPEQKEILRQIASYIAYNGAFDYKQVVSVDKDLAIKLMQTFTDVPRNKMLECANDTIMSLSDFLLSGQSDRAVA